MRPYKTVYVTDTCILQERIIRSGKYWLVEKDEKCEEGVDKSDGGTVYIRQTNQQVNENIYGE